MIISTGNLFSIFSLCDIAIRYFQIHRFTTYASGDINPDDLVLKAWIYIHRYQENTQMPVTLYNIYSLLGTSLVVAEKHSTDEPFKMSHYAKVVGFSKEGMLHFLSGSKSYLFNLINLIYTELNEWEMKFITGLDWNFIITKEEVCNLNLHSMYDCSLNKELI